MNLRKPWIGNQFNGLLVLGESHYGNAEDDGLTTQVVQEAVDGVSTHAFFTKIEIVVTGEALRKRGPNSFWHHIAFANFCPGAVDGPRHRPSEEMWAEGYRLFPELLLQVRPKRILVLGNELWDNIGALTDTALLSAPKKPREAGRLDMEAGAAGSGVPIASIRHPSSFGFSSAKWHDFYRSFVEVFPVTGSIDNLRRGAFPAQPPRHLPL